ncbi:Fe-S oxidoreductase [Candidatus Scalindua japonica]|uniref:Fe-S oxidoreductase n=1 Tax=Candidatus Scalindua japonica TaxID=1284222 RepID=A0A286U1X9_9BACT|nr:Fe-S oxidoreductase [Candidatus Scalindua japonica]
MTFIYNVEIIGVWESQYEGLKKNNFFLPLSSPHLEALFPSDFNVIIRNEQVQPVEDYLQWNLLISKSDGHIHSC